MGKKLNLSNINKEHSKFNEKFVAHILDGQYDVEIHRYFKTTEIQKLLIDYQTLLEQLRKQHIDIDTIQTMTYLFPTLIIKYFTNVDIPLQLDKMLLVVEKLIDIGAYEEILKNLPQEEFDKVNKMLNQVLDNQSKIGDLMGDVMLRDALVVEEEKDADI